MDKRRFLLIGALGLLGAALGCGQSRATAPAAATQTSDGSQKLVKCPNCGTDNVLQLGPDGKPIQLKCWRCGHEWVPQLAS